MTVPRVSSDDVRAASVKGAATELFASHPPLEKRLAALSQIAREMGRPV